MSSITGSDRPDENKFSAQIAFRPMGSGRRYVLGGVLTPGANTNAFNFLTKGPLTLPSPPAGEGEGEGQSR